MSGEKWKIRMKVKKRGARRRFSVVKYEREGIRRAQQALKKSGKI